MKTGAVQHRKMKKLARLLHIPIYGAVGIMEMLWAWTQENAIAGDIGKAEDFEIEEAVGWPTDSLIALVPQLLEAGWLDLNLEHRLLVHDWPEHCPDFIHTRLFRAGRNFADGTPPKVKLVNLKGAERERAKSELQSPVDFQQKSMDQEQKSMDKWPLSTGTQPNPTQPNPTNPNQYGGENLPTPDTDPDPPRATPPPKGPRPIRPSGGLTRISRADLPEIPSKARSELAETLAAFAPHLPSPMHDPPLMARCSAAMQAAGWTLDDLADILKRRRETLRSAQSWGMLLTIVEAACRGKPQGPRRHPAGRILYPGDDGYEKAVPV